MRLETKQDIVRRIEARRDQDLTLPQQAQVCCGWSRLGTERRSRRCLFASLPATSWKLGSRARSREPIRDAPDDLTERRSPGRTRIS